MKKIAFSIMMLLITSCAGNIQPTENSTLKETLLPGRATEQAQKAEQAGTIPDVSVSVEPGAMIRLSLDEYPEAVCNDGTSAAYYFRQGSGDNIDKWIVYLDGGGQCTSIQSCNSRAERLFENMTTKPEPSILLGGILSPDPFRNPDFYNFNHVFVHYCSSDTWAGDQNATADTGNYLFKGHKIIEALFTDLLTENNNSGSVGDASDILLMGVSAGANGVQNNLDYVATLLPSSVRLRGFMDSYWRIADLKNSGLPVLDESESSETVLKLWNPRFDESCMQAVESINGCSGEALLPYLDHDIFVFVDQSDDVIAAISRYSPEQIDLYRKLLEESLNDVSGIFSPDEGLHGSVAGSPFYELSIDSIPYRDVIANWFFDRDGPKKLFLR